MSRESEITKNSELEAGKYYHCFNRQTVEHTIEQCRKNTDGSRKYVGNHIWACDDNSQALSRWLIIGPIEVPPAGGMYLCAKHHGYGFPDDCFKCIENSKNHT